MVRRREPAANADPAEVASQGCICERHYETRIRIQNGLYSIKVTLRPERHMAVVDFRQD